MIDFEFISTWWFRLAIAFICFTIYTIIILKAEEKRRKENE